MKHFDIILRSFADVQEFLEVATIQPFRVVVGNNRTLVNAKSFIGLFSLDFSQPIQVRADCSSEECDRFRNQLASSLQLL